MALTQIEQLLMGYLHLSKASRGGQALAYIALDTEEQIIAQARKIAQAEQEVLSKC